MLQPTFRKKNYLLQNIWMCVQFKWSRISVKDDQSLCHSSLHIEAVIIAVHVKIIFCNVREIECQWGKEETGYFKLCLWMLLHDNSWSYFTFIIRELMAKHSIPLVLHPVQPSEHNVMKCTDGLCYTLQHVLTYFWGYLEDIP